MTIFELKFTNLITKTVIIIKLHNYIIKLTWPADCSFITSNFTWLRFIKLFHLCRGNEHKKLYQLSNESKFKMYPSSTNMWLYNQIVLQYRHLQSLIFSLQQNENLCAVFSLKDFFLLNLLRRQVQYAHCPSATESI